MRRLPLAANAAFLFVSLFSLLVSTPSLATILHVPGDYATIQAAIDAAVVGDIVEVACGTYQVPEIIMKSGITLRSATGQADCVIVEPLDNPGGPERLLRCLVDATTVIEGITFRGGYDLYATPIYVSGSPSIVRCNFVENRGRGVPLSSGDLLVRGGTECYEGNAAIVFHESDAVVSHCVFSGNFSAAGAVWLCGDVNFESCAFVGNSAEWAGGAVSGIGGRFDNCMFSGNHAYLAGGAVVITNGAFNACEFYANTSGITGGAAQVIGTRLEYCLFKGNYTGGLAYMTGEIGGGAVHVSGGIGSGPTDILNCTFVQNDATLPRYTSGENGVKLESHVSVSHGSAVLAEAGLVVLAGIVVAGNVGSEALYFEPGVSVAVTCSNIFGNPDGDWVGAIAGQLGVNGNISVDPMFCDAAGGDFQLSSLSPCLYAECGAMGAFGQGCLDDKPALFRVKDIGNDQGRQVRLTWQRSAHDSPTANPYVTGYAVYRKKDAFAKDVPLPQTARGESVAILGWDYLGTVPSRGDSIYETVVPTLCDSTITDGQCLSTFFVSAMTPNPFVFYDSPIHEGYSIDNLAPPTPTGFAIAYNTGDGNQLEWDAVAAADFAGFRVYRDGELAATTTQTSWNDPDVDGWDVEYSVTSFDGAGNESAPAVGGTTTDVPTVASRRLELLPNVPNPFNPSTRLSFTTPSAGPVQLAIYDARGTLVRVLVDKSYPAGHHDAVWDGRDGKGSPVSSGVYMCRLVQRSESHTRKIVLIK